jgi:hypothetical protein
MESIRVSTKLQFPKKEYQDLMTEEIISYVARQSLPAISTVTSDSIEDFKSVSNVVVVGYFAPDDGISNEAFKSVAEALHENYLFGVANDDALAKAEQISQALCYTRTLTRERTPLS